MSKQSTEIDGLFEVDGLGSRPRRRMTREALLDHLAEMSGELRSLAEAANFKELEVAFESASRIARAQMKQANTSEHTQEGMNHALVKYAAIREELETNHPNSYVAIDPSSGVYTVDRTAMGAKSAFRKRYGDRVAFTLHIGTT